MGAHGLCGYLHEVFYPGSISRRADLPEREPATQKITIGQQWRLCLITVGQTVGDSLGQTVGDSLAGDSVGDLVGRFTAPVCVDSVCIA